MKRQLLLLIGLLSACLCFSQNEHSERKIKRIDNKLYIVENDITNEVDQTRIIVKLKPQRELPKTLCKDSRDLGFGIMEIPVPTGMKVEDYLSLMEHSDDFEFVDYNTYGEYLYTPNDSLVGNGAGQQWYLASINAYDAWDITTGSSSIKVAVLDSGVDSCHYDLHYGSDNYTHLDIPNGYNYPHDTNYSSPTNYHGTMVAGLLGAKTNNNRGIAGVSGGNNSAGITIIPFNVGDVDPVTSYVISAINNAVTKGAKIINLSIALIYNSGLDYAINAAYNQGVTIVCGTGNGLNSSIRYPASNSNTIAVGSIDQSNQRAYFSNYGTGLDFVAPGVYMTSTSLNNEYYSYYGTSFSAPLVTGVAALMLSVNPSLTPSQIRTILRNTCTKLSGYSYDSYGWNEEVGYGLLNAFSAVYSSSPHTIVGPSTLYNSSGSYYIENLPNGVNVEWSLSDSYFNQNCLQQNSPSQNQCTISCSSVQDMTNAVLTATIKHNGTVVETITKNGVCAYQGFKGTYTSSFGSGQYTAPNSIFTAPNTLVTVTSPRLVGATLTYTGDATPSYWNHSNNTLKVRMPSTGAAIIVYVHCSNGDDYMIPIIKSNSPYLSLCFIGETLNIMLDESVAKDQSWMLEICNALNGEKIITQEVFGNTVSLNTSGWKRGLYVVRVTIGKVVLTEKILVK